MNTNLPFNDWPAMNEVTAGMTNGQWLAIFILIVSGFIFQGFLRIFLRRFEGFLTGKVKDHLNQADLPTDAKIRRPMGVLAMGIVWKIGAEWVQFSDQVAIQMGVALNVFVLLSLIWFLWQLVNWISLVLEHKAAITESKLDDLLVPFVRTGLKTFVVILAFILGADALELPIKTLLTGLGIGSLAFALAAQNTIENLFGSITVVMDRPFNIGDWVIIGSLEGTVEKMGFRSTRLRTFYDSEIIIPNSKLIKAEVDNMGQRRYRRIKTMLSVTYDTPAESIEAFCEGIRELIRNHPYTRKDTFHVYLNQYNASSMDIMLYCFVKVPDWGTELQERERLFLDIKRLAESLEVEFAFPTQTLYMRKEDTPLKSASDSLLQQATQRARQLAGNHIENGQKPEKAEALEDRGS